jgi:hypothetical protein
MARHIDLVFRTIGERTADVALQLGLESIRPDGVYVLENKTPFWRTVEEMLALQYRGDYIVFMDADCLLLEDLRPFLDANTRPHVDACLVDKFRGWVTGGVHVLRRDVVQAMRAVPIDASDTGYYLKPESWIRWRALAAMGEFEGIRRMHVLHDFEQDYRHLFAKYMIRDLRSRRSHLRMALDRKMREWDLQDPDFRVARAAVEFSRRIVSRATSSRVAAVLPGLPDTARKELQDLAVPLKPAFTREAAERLRAAWCDTGRWPPRPGQAFGISLSPAALKSLAKAMAALGMTGTQVGPTLTPQGLALCDLSLLEEYDALTGVALAPFYAPLAAAFPDCRFVLVIPDRDAWLAEVEAARGDPGGRLAQTLAHLFGPNALATSRAPDALAQAAAGYYDEVRGHFAGRAGALMTLELAAGSDWDRLYLPLEQAGIGLPVPAMA